MTQGSGSPFHPDGPPKHFVLVTDAWAPQVNGVVRTWEHVTEYMRAAGHRVTVVHPGMFQWTVRAPRYPEVRLAIFGWRAVDRTLKKLSPDAVHIATEGPLGLAARRSCSKQKWGFTTSYHTQFPQVIQSYFFIPAGVTYRFMKWFHGKAHTTLVPTKTVAEELAERGIHNTRVWCRGVDHTVFKPYKENVFDLTRPIWINVGRVATEKNIEAFLDLDLPGSKVVVGDGPARASLQKRYPDVHWAGYKFGEELGKCYASADVMVFPSLTDTFGVVILEANACGLPVAAFPVTGPRDVVVDDVTGCLNDDLHAACLQAMELDHDACLAHAQTNTWQRCADMAMDTFVSVHDGPAPKHPRRLNAPVASATH